MFVTGPDLFKRVVVNDALSELVDVTSGLSHGSVLGPLLFVLFIYEFTDVGST